MIRQPDSTGRRSMGWAGWWEWEWMEWEEETRMERAIRRCGRI
jgi:hypothetical protein